AAMLNAVGFYVVLTYLPVYLETVVMMPASESSLITTISLIAYIAFIFGSGHLSDKYGRKKMLIIACVSFIVLTVPAFMLLNTGLFVAVLGVELVLCLALTINDGTLSSYLTETFPTAVRYTGFALSFNMANALFGGSASFISTALIAATGSNLAPAWYMVGVSCVALVAMILSHEHTGKDLSEV
ncbi:MFS transporter, partial [Gordonibacter sp.]